jgi:uncharacterized membrane protein YkoI
MPTSHALARPGPLLAAAASVAAAALAVCLLPAAGLASRVQEKPKWKGTIPVDFARMAQGARISMADAEKAAVASLGFYAANATVAHKELATQHDALVYQVVVLVKDKQRAIQVDAATGKVLAQGERGSIRLGLGRMAKVSRPYALRIALAAAGGDAAHESVGDGELEVENGYLVYDFAVKVQGKPGVFKVLVDAGNGKALATQHVGAEGGN